MVVIVGGEYRSGLGTNGLGVTGQVNGIGGADGVDSDPERPFCQRRACLELLTWDDSYPILIDDRRHVTAQQVSFSQIVFKRHLNTIDKHQHFSGA